MIFVFDDTFTFFYLLVMSNNTWEDKYIEYLNFISTEIDRSLSIVIFFFGVLGNIANIIVLSQRTFCRNPCAWLFLMSSIANLISLLFGLSTRILAGWSKDPTEHISWACKCRSFLLFTSRTVAFWLIAFATINRALASSRNVRHRQINTLKNVQIYSLAIVLLSIIIYSHTFYCYEANLTDSPLKCYGNTVACRIISDLFYGWFSIIIPLILMTIFGIKTVVHIRQSQRRIHNTTISHQRQAYWTKKDHSLLLMLCIQIIIQAVLTLPQVCSKFYISLTISQLQKPLKLTVDHSLYNLTLLLSFIANTTPFYVYTLFGGHVFRKSLIDLIKKKLCFFQ